MTTATETHALEIVRLLGARPEIVFEAWSSAEHARRWWYPRQDGRDFECKAFTMDFRVGGTYRYCIRSPQGHDSWAHGAFREIVPARRLVFTFQWEQQPQLFEETLITVTFAPAGAGATRLTFRQEPFADRAMRDSHEGGWGAVLDRLAERVDAAGSRA
jgi:uncharacterized protein YndB with AHSA1/START domain